MNKIIFVSLIAAAIMLCTAAQYGYCDTPSQSAPGVDAASCAACHDKQTKSMTDPGMHASVHAKKGIDKCSSCHDPAALKEAHANVKPGESKFVKARRYPKDFCLKCHGKPADLAKRTAGCKFLTDTKGKVVNPHEIPQNPKHEKMDECFMCHKEHKAKPDIKNYCMSCHHTGEFITCSKCHS